MVDIKADKSIGSSLKRRRGIVVITKDRFERNLEKEPKFLKFLFSLVYPYYIETDRSNTLSGHKMSYHCYSEHFIELNEGDQIPHYDFTFKEGIDGGYILEDCEVV